MGDGVSTGLGSPYQRGRDAGLLYAQSKNPPQLKAAVQDAVQRLDQMLEAEGPSAGVQNLLGFIDGLNGNSDASAASLVRRINQGQRRTRRDPRAPTEI